MFFVGKLFARESAKRTAMRTCRNIRLAAILMSVPLALLLSAVALAGIPPLLQVRVHSFPNGLGLYHVKVVEATNFKLSVTVWVGSVDEDRKTNGGVSHLLEHILFHQPDMPQKEFQDQIKLRGGTYNGTTAADYTQYAVSLRARHLELGQNWLFKVLFHGPLVIDRLNEEKEVVDREHGWSPPSWWDRLLSLIAPKYIELPGFWNQHFGLSEYDEPVGGTYEVASGLAASQLEAHYRKYYYPENMVLLYVGPHELEEVAGLIERTFGSVRPAVRAANLRPILGGKFPRPYFSHEFQESSYYIRIGHVFTGLGFSELSEFILYTYALRELLNDRFRWEKGETYSVSNQWARYRGAGYLQFDLQANRDNYWTQLEEVKKLVGGGLGKHLSERDYERYKTSLLEVAAATREIDSVHDRVLTAAYYHPLHRPSPEEADIYKRLRSLTYNEFLGWVSTWRQRTKPLLVLGMPVLLFPYAHFLIFVLFVALGVQSTRSFLQRSSPREDIRLVTGMPYGITGWIYLVILYAIALFVVLHVSWVIQYGISFFSRSNILALLAPYLELVIGGVMIGVWIVMGGAIMPREVLVTDTALVLRMRSPLSFRIPISDIEKLESVSGWTAWKEMLRLRALPLHPWFFRGLVIHRVSGRSLLVHTKDDQALQDMLALKLSTRAELKPTGDYATQRALTAMAGE